MITLFCFAAEGSRAEQVRLINGVAVPPDFPVIHTQVYGKTGPGRIFFSSTFFDSGTRSNYIVICENDGTPYFYRRLSRANLGSGDFTCHPNGLLSYYKYNSSDDGFFVIMDSTFTEIDTFRCAGNYRTDSHELVLLPNGHALLVCEEDSTVDMNRIVTGGQTRAIVVGNHIQEVDSKGNLYWMWRCWDHLDIEDATDINLTQHYIDYVHLNSMAVDTDGHYIVSFRSQSTIAKIHRGTGEILWRFGGRKNQFTIKNDNLNISSQHHVRPVPNSPGHYTFYDNGNYRFPNATRAVEYLIDPASRIAERVWEYRYPAVHFAYMMGSVQRLENGNTYIDWSTEPPMRSCEVDSDNTLLFEMRVEGISGYRSFRFDWNGKMTRPFLEAESLPEAVRLIFNQFGAQVSRYEIYTGNSPDTPDYLTSTSRTYAELTQLQNGTRVWFRVRAVSQDGTVSGFSDPVSAEVQYSNPGVNLVLNGDFSSGTDSWNITARNGGEANASVSEGICRIDIQSGGSDTPDIALIQDGLRLIQGRLYRFEFDARADALRPAAPLITGTDNPAVYSRTALTALPTRWKHYAYEFTMQEPTDSNARISLQCGDSEIPCYFDNISLVEAGEQPAGPETGADDFKLTANFPNPFRTETTVRVLVPVPSVVRVTLYDLLGRQTAVLLNGLIEAGWESITFKNPGLSSGVYICRLDASPVSSNRHFHHSRKWLLLK